MTPSRSVHSYLVPLGPNPPSLPYRLSTQAFAAPRTRIDPTQNYRPLFGVAFRAKRACLASVVETYNGLDGHFDGRLSETWARNSYRITP